MASSPPPRGRQVNVFQAIALLLSFVLVAGVGGLLAGGLLLPAAAVVSGTADLATTAFDDLPSDLAAKPLSEKSVMLAADGTTVIAEFYAENREVVPLAEISQSMQDAVIATEDKRFYSHGAIDPTGMLRAGVRNSLNQGVTEGASTLTQQYVKNMLIANAMRENDNAAAAAAREAEGPEGIRRKLREAKLAIAMEKVTPKETILEGYLNIAQFGVALYGVESASQRFFSKHASELSYLEAATLAGVTNSPTANDPAKNPETSEKRRNLVLTRMRDQGYIDQAQYDQGVATPIADTLHLQDTKVGCMAAGDSVPGSGYFCDYVTKVMAQDPAFGETKADRVDRLYRGGLTITTTLDPNQQAIADAEVKARIPVNDPSGVGIAMSIVQPNTGQITAMAQNRDYNNTKLSLYDPTQPITDRETSVNYNADFRYGSASGFAPGSTFKPFTLAQWLKDGHSLNETVDGSVRPLNENMFTHCGKRGLNVSWKPGNSEGGAGTMSVLDATRNSVNLAYLTMATQLDLCDIMNTAADLGIHKAGGNAGDGPFDAFPANVIGSQSVAPLAMAAAFAAFGTGGTFCEPIAITSVRDTDNTELPVPSANCRAGLEPAIANAVTYALSNVWGGTAQGVTPPPFPSAGKTGTTSHNESTWFVGYSTLLSGAVWVGFPDKSFTPVQHMTVGGVRVKFTYGSTFAAPTWSRFMTRALEGQSVPGFAAIDDLQLHGKPVQVPTVVGQSVEAATASLKASGFNAKVAPDQVASDYPAGTVASQSVTGMSTRGTWVTLTVSNGQSPTAPGPGGEGGGGNPPGGGNPGGGRDDTTPGRPRP